MSRREKSHVESLPPLSDREVEEGLSNLEMCLEALDRKGEEGLQEALDKIYGPESRPVFLREPIFRDSYIIRRAGSRSTPPSVPASPRSTTTPAPATETTPSSSTTPASRR